MEEELPFAGHPIIGAAALLHHLHSPAEQAQWTLHLPNKSVQINSRRAGQGFYAEMDQGQAEFGQALSQPEARRIRRSFGLSSNELDSRYPANVVSTGLPYVLLPVTASGLAKAKQCRLLDVELLNCGAAFVYLLDVDGLEGRTWDPAGQVEDIATGSAAGPVAAYLVQQGVVHRKRRLASIKGGSCNDQADSDVCVGVDGRVRVGGHVQLLACAQLLIDPAQLG